MWITAVILMAATGGCATAKKTSAGGLVPFEPAWWCRGAHQQTIFGALLRPVPPLQLQRQRWETPDGDFMDLDWLPGAPGTPILIVLHGLEGSARSRYVLSLLAERGLSRAQENLAIIWDSRTFTGEPSPTDTPEDRIARALFQRLLDYYEMEVQTFFSEPTISTGEESAGLEERQAAQDRVRIFLGTLWKEAPKGKVPIVLGESTGPLFKALAGLEEYGIFRHERGKESDLVAKLIVQENARFFIFAGLEGEASALRPLAKRAQMDFALVSPTGTPFQQILTLLAKATGLKEATIQAREGFQEFLTGLEELSSGA